MSAASEGASSVVISDGTRSVVPTPALLSLLVRSNSAQPPLTQGVVAGNSVTFSARITGNPVPLTCQRRKGGSLADSMILSEGISSIVCAMDLAKGGHATWIVNLATTQVEAHSQTGAAPGQFFGAARLSPDNRRLYLPVNENSSHSIRCIDHTGQVVVALDEPVMDWVFAAGGRALVTVLNPVDENGYGIQFHDLENPGRPPRQVFGQNHTILRMATPRDGSLVAVPTFGGVIHLFDPVRGELVDTLHGHLGACFWVAFSEDGTRLISSSSDAKQPVKLWDVGTRQELLTLPGRGVDGGGAVWSADGDTIATGAPWQTWRAPSWAVIQAAEAKDSASPSLGGAGKTGNRQP